MGPILLALFAVLGVVVILLIAVAIALALAGIPAFRIVAKGSRETNAALQELAAKSEELNASLEELAERQAELDRHLGRLGVSVERLSILAWALADARSALADVRALIPRK